ncbi:NAD-dependent epimerase/dehydratase family protein [Bdellovibrio sp. KM01]|uniref:NAD-dependent epimerase/dehydratase family protein n=1 Tax=Bdellovibrio sp. KM01 TaxID=2748865 RepID=UPI0015E912D2|nr:NAD-dependent epimerase/dehydratase family protein [Bdellovibrio sp. KM01]QLY27019.1 NAD-dependent epimerase/dehydratase family protein [Bdellovibrio sp. KM01]
MSSDFWRGRKVFITGHTGFRGSHLALALKKAGAEVFGFSLSPSTNPNFFEVANVGQGMSSTFGDVRDGTALKASLEFSQAEVVFHLAGGGGLRDSWDKVSETYSSQVMGSVNLLECLRETATVRAVVFLSSDKVYRPSKTELVESDPLAGGAPAATAKACVDLILESYLQGVFAPEKYNKHKIALASARMGSAIGGGDFSPESFIWQLAQANQAGLDLPLKNPDSIRPWMHVDDAVSALRTLAQGLLEQGPKLSGAWNLGVGTSHQMSVGQATEIFKAQYRNSSVKEFTLASKGSTHGLLNSEKALNQLSWQPHVSVEVSIQKTADWYKQYFA